MPPKSSMNNLRKTNKASRKISKQNAQTNKCNEAPATIYNTTKDQFKTLVLSLTHTTKTRRLDRLRPPALDLVSNIKRFNPIAINAINTSTYRFLNTHQLSTQPSESLFPLMRLPPPPPPPTSSASSTSSWSPLLPPPPQEYQQHDNILPPKPEISPSWIIDFLNSRSPPSMLFNPTSVSSPTTGVMKK